MVIGKTGKKDKREKKKGEKVNNLSYNTARHITSEDSLGFSVFLGAFFST